MRNKKKLQQEFMDILMFLECLHLYLQTGVEFSYAWKKATVELQAALIKSETLLKLSRCQNQLFGEFLLQISQNSWPELCSMWFELVSQSYNEGGAMIPVVEGFLNYLHRQLLIMEDRHFKQAQTSVQVILMLTALPMSLGLICFVIFSAVLY